MIPRPLTVSGCAVDACDRQVATVMNVLADILKKGNHAARRVLDVPLCAVHAEEMMTTADHPGAAFYRPEGPLFRRALVVEPQLVIEGESRRWPTYQELLRAAMR